MMNYTKHNTWLKKLRKTDVMRNNIYWSKFQVLLQLLYYLISPKCWRCILFLILYQKRQRLGKIK